MQVTGPFQALVKSLKISCKLSFSFRQEGITSTEDDVPPESISGSVTCLVDSKWWLACVLDLNLDEN